MAMLQDMRTGAPGFAQAGNFLLDTAFHQVWRRFGLPTGSFSAGALAGAKTIDFQAGYETTMGFTLGALAGASMLFFHGGLTQQKALHPVKIILDDDVAGMVGRYLRGIEVTAETLAVDVIDAVGPIPGDFLTTAHTRKWWKSEQYLTKSADHLPYEQWVMSGSKTAIQHGLERMEQILATHKPMPLPPDQEVAIEGILNEARQYYRGKGLISDEEWRLYQEDLNSPDYPFA
jgi:trimethylamine--corrinoid protein Co-methyltransferase